MECNSTSNKIGTISDAYNKYECDAEILSV